MDILERFEELETRLAEDRRRRQHDRIRTVVTMVSEPVPDEPADTFSLSVKATSRLRAAMVTYQDRYADPWGIEETPKNFYPRYGPQLTIDEDAILKVTGWSWDTWYDGKPEQLVDLLRDFVYSLTEYYPLVQFPRGRTL